MAEKTKEKLLTYEAIKNALSVEHLDYGSFQVYNYVKHVKNTDLYNKIKELTEMAYPTSVDDSEISWAYFYVPLVFEGSPALIPMIIKYSKRSEKEAYIVGFLSIDSLQSLEVARGDEKADPLFGLAIESAKEFLPNLIDVKEIEKRVPYHFRIGYIKGKYIASQPLMTKEETERIKASYKEQKEKAKNAASIAKKISLNQYLYAASIVIKAVFPELERLTPLEAYKKTADFRDGGMLSINDFDSAEEFNRWYESKEWQGSHPFEIIAGYSTNGISLYPPSSDGYFVLSLGDDLFAEDYLRALRALLQAGIPVKAPELSNVLKYLSGEYYVKINVPGSIAYSEIPEDKLRYVKWERLDVVKPKLDLLRT